VAKTTKDSAILKIRKRIVPVRDAAPYAKILLYGRNGAGKTRIGATGPKTLLVDIEEQGTKSIRNYPGVEVLHATKWEDIVWTYWFLRSGEHEYETVVLDTITMMAVVCMKQVLKDSVDRDPARDPKMASQRDWGKMGQMVGEQLLNYRNLPMHVVFTAQERGVESEGEGDLEAVKKEIVPDLSPKPRSIATACVDFIGHIRKRQVRSVNKKTKKETKSWRTIMLVGPHETYLTKDQSGVLPRLVANPTVPMMVEAAKSIEE